MSHKYTTNIPLARECLSEIADDIEGQMPIQAERIREICASLMTRAPSKRRAPTTRATVTPAIEQSVRQMLDQTDLSQEEIGRRHGIDGGRVSEILNKEKTR